MNRTTEDDMRAQIAQALPCALKAAFSSYQKYLEENPDRETFDFKDHHSNCKIALGHIALLIKLAQWALTGENAGSGGQAALALMIENARKELENKEYQERGEQAEPVFK